MAKIYWFCSTEQFHPEVILTHAIAAEKAGFDGIMISEHFHPWVDDEGTAGATFSTLGAIATKTTTVKLMTAVTSPLFRFHPAVIAQFAATIDRLSSGRFELGIGSGENINESPLGFKLPSYKERSDRIKESIQIMRRLLNGERLDYEGLHYQTCSAKLYSPPISNVPIYLAAGGPKSAKTAGKYCEGVITSVKDVKQSLENVIDPAKLESKHKSFTVVASRWSVFAQNNDEAWQALSAQRGLRAPSRDYASNPLELQHEADSIPREEIINKYPILKSAQDYIKTYSPLITELGANIIGIQTTSLNQISTINMIGQKVLPVLKNLK